MTDEELETIAYTLARPCVLLRESGPKADLGAAWGGEGIVPAPKSGNWRHWISVDCGWFKETLHRYGLKIGPPAGVLSVYTDEDSEGGVAVHNAKAKLKVGKGALALFGHPGRSLPPLEAIFLKGPAPVQEWLTKNKWKSEWGYSDKFKDRKIAENYIRRYQNLSPFYSGSAHAVLGGWHFPWPDGDWAELIERALLVWTLEDSEPWIEVWGVGKKFEVKQRIT